MDWRQAHQLQQLSTCTLTLTSVDAQCFITMHLGMNGCCDYVGLYHGFAWQPGWQIDSQLMSEKVKRRLHLVVQSNSPL